MDINSDSSKSKYDAASSSAKTLAVDLPRVEVKQPEPETLLGGVERYKAGISDTTNDLVRMNLSEGDDLCDEDTILVFFKRLLMEWKQELVEIPDSDNRVATFEQCARYLHPLFNLCKEKVVPDDIRKALVMLVECCKQREYLGAMDHYIKMVIGNDAPWPARFVMNDRKYLQSVKRLMTFCQRRYPSKALSDHMILHVYEL